MATSKPVDLINADMANEMLMNNLPSKFNNIIKYETGRGYNSARVYRQGQMHLFQWLTENKEYVENENGYTLDFNTVNGYIDISW